MDGSGKCTELPHEADSIDCSLSAGWMSRISARGLGLGRRRENAARIMADRPTLAGDSVRAAEFAMDGGGNCSALSLEADPFDCSLSAGRVPRIFSRDIGLQRERNNLPAVL